MVSKQTTKFRIRGADEVFKNLRLVPDKLREEVAWPATIEAMDYAKQIAIENAQKVDRLSTRNYIPDNIDIAERRELGKKMRAAYVSLGVRKRTKGQGGGQTFYWWLVELGTAHSRAKPFMRPVFEQNSTRIIKEFIGTARFKMSQMRF